MHRSYNDYIVQLYSPEDPKANCRDVTFQVTDECCLHCSYCYQINKGHRYMTPETAKEIVDLLFKMYDENNEDAFINHHTKGIILDYIGGEPFMNVKTMDAATEYFIQKCVEKNHIWLTNFRISISSNGMMYFDPEVQAFLNKYLPLIGMTITIDGPKEVHDACRKDYDGNGSFDKVFAAWDHWLKKIEAKNIETKVTIAPENLPLLDKIFDFFLDYGVTELFANPIYEHTWTKEEGTLYYHQLQRLAERLLKDNHAYASLFDITKGKPMSLKETQNWCGGVGSMLAFDPEGKAYPCLRYMESSLGTQCPPVIIGNTKAIYETLEERRIYQSLCDVTRISQSSDECLNCHVASGCGWCSAYNYQATGSWNKRTTNICWMHRAEALANVYYWNQYYALNNKTTKFPCYLSRDIATQIISQQEYDILLQMSMS